MEKEFVSYEHSVALKELGLKDKCIATVENNGYVHIKGTRGLPSAAAVVNKVDAPLKQQVFRWFREKYELFVDVYPLAITASDKTGYRYSYLTYNLNGLSESDSEIIGHYSYEEAENACIDKLIELAKQKIEN